LKHYSLRTEEVYLGWIRRFVLAHGRRHPRELGAAEVERFLSGLATQGNVAASTQNQALSALLFLYRQVLGIELPWMEGVVRAKRPQRVPTVLSREEVTRLLACMEGRPWLLASLLYGTGMRLMVAVAGEGRGLRPQGNHGAGWQGRKGSPHDVAANAGRTPAARGRAGGYLARRRPGRRLRGRVAAACAGEEVSQRATGAGLAVRVSGATALARPARRYRAKASLR
jgi:hypothetical protein